MQNVILKRNDLVYPELSYKIVGVLFTVYNDLGGGYREKYYQKAIALEFKTCNLKFKEQVYFPVKFKNNFIGKDFIDFIVEDRVVVEVKCGVQFRRQHIQQIFEYLKASKLKLGILAVFTKSGMRFKRIVNIKNS